jgi:hypothetical protein
MVFLTKKCEVISSKIVPQDLVQTYVGLLMEQHVFYYFDDYRGHHRKGIAIYTATDVNLHLKTLVSFNKNVFLNTEERFKQENFN